jgi:hypothetical protein
VREVEKRRRRIGIRIGNELKGKREKIRVGRVKEKGKTRERKKIKR